LLANIELEGAVVVVVVVVVAEFITWLALKKD
jgi:hypothetical protein